MKLSNFSFSAFATSIAALGGLAIAGYQAFNHAPQPAKDPTQVEVHVAVDGQGQTKVVSAAAPQTAAPAGQATQGAQAPRPVVAAQAVSGLQLLSNMKQAIAIIPASYTEQGGAKYRNSAQVVSSSAEAAAAVDELDRAVRGRDGKKVSAATKRTARAVNKLQTSYSVSPGRSERATRALGTIDSNWSTYTARYALAKPAGKVKPSADQVKKLKRDVKKLEQRIADLERQNAKNKAMRRELERTRAELAYYDDFSTDNYSYDRYQALLITINGIYGSFDALASYSQVYYPDEYQDFQQLYSEDDVAGAYWDGYYDSYYDNAQKGWYQEPFQVPQTVQLAPEPSVVTVQNITINQNITIQQINEITASAQKELKSAPVQKASAEPPPPLPARVSSNSADILKLSSEIATVAATSQQPAPLPASKAEATAPAAQAPAAESTGKGDVAATPAEPAQQVAPAEPAPAKQDAPAASAPVDQAAPVAPAAAEQPAPAEPAPAKQDAPAAPAPADQAAPAAPAPADQAAPVEPAPADQAAPVEPAPADQAAPAEPAPADQAAPVEPAPAEQAAPVEPAPDDQAAPAEPAPAEQAAPAEPAPADQAAPAEPAPADQAAPAPADQAAPADQPAAGGSTDATKCAEGADCPPAQ